MILHDYWRSSAGWRVRIALALKGVHADRVTHHLRRGEQRQPDFLRINPQGLLPALIVNDSALTQSLAIIEWLDETYPDPPMLPREALSRAKVRGFALAIACDVHPLQNLHVLNRLRALGHDEATVSGWAQDVIAAGLDACERLVGERPGSFCFGQQPTLADICLVPQLANGRRFGLAIERWPGLTAIEAACMELPAFAAARPEQQSDAETN